MCTAGQKQASAIRLQNQIEDHWNLSWFMVSPCYNQTLRLNYCQAKNKRGKKKKTGPRAVHNISLTEN